MIVTCAAAVCVRSRFASQATPSITLVAFVPTTVPPVENSVPPVIVQPARRHAPIAVVCVKVPLIVSAPVTFTVPLVPPPPRFQRAACTLPAPKDPSKFTVPAITSIVPLFVQLPDCVRIPPFARTTPPAAIVTGEVPEPTVTVWPDVVASTVPAIVNPELACDAYTVPAPPVTVTPLPIVINVPPALSRSEFVLEPPSTTDAVEAAASVDTPPDPGVKNT